MTRRWLSLTAACATVALAGCAQDPITTPSGRPNLLLSGGSGPIADEYDGRPVHGAIFTTLPFGQSVNANVQYTRKIEVYLDGGPRNPNALAAGLNDGLYVFQITDPAGKNLLSQDPARCRVVQVKGGVILGTVPANRIPGLGASDDTWAVPGTNGKKACHVESAEADGASLAGHHDTNVDSDQGGGVTVQMMPFLDTPNPGGVYKAWITPLKSYLEKGGDLNAPAKPASGQRTGNAPDKGFANPSRQNVKTDNFKVREQPPIIEIKKYVDGVETPGWLVTVYEAIDGSLVGAGWRPTTATFGVPFNTEVLACEQVPAGYKFVSAVVGGSTITTPEAEPTKDEHDNPIACVKVPGVAVSSTVSVAFNNHKVVRTRASRSSKTV